MKITYLFGAGASKHALPIVNEIPARIREMLKILETDALQLSEHEYYEDVTPLHSKAIIQKSLMEDIKWLLTSSENHASIDTFAKKLYIKDKLSDLNRLKTAFSVYLVLEQMLHKPDMRYDSFYASILNKNYYEFPSNIRIVSWNYDSQFEIAFSDYAEDKRLESNKTHLNVICKSTRDRPIGSRFCLLKLNGTTNILQANGNREFFYTNEITSHLNIEILDIIMRNYASIKFSNQKLFSGLSFAWERPDGPLNDIVQHAKKQTEDTEILIVVGYSFPYFNREVDREIIGCMSSLKKVYFQAPDAEILKERFLSIRSDINPENLVTRFDVGQFLIPNEF